MSASAPEVELLWWAGCPSWQQALAELRAALADTGLDPESVVVREVGGDEDAQRERFVGSPTIRVAGADVQPPGPKEPVSLTCRIYHLHFISADRTRGGHVLDFASRSARVRVDPSANLHVELPAGVELAAPDLSAATHDALARVESSG